MHVFLLRPRRERALQRCHVLLSLEWGSQSLSTHVGFEISLGNMGEFWYQQDLAQKQPEQVPSPISNSDDSSFVSSLSCLWTARAREATPSDLSKAPVHTPVPCHGFGTVPLLPLSRWHESTLGLADNSAFAEKGTDSFKDHHHNAGLRTAGFELSILKTVMR